MTMQAIQTRYFGPTNMRGSRIKAFSEAFPRGVTVPFEHAIGIEGNHDAAARAFIKAHEWYGSWARGGAADNRGYVYVCFLADRGGEYRTPCLRCAESRDLLVVRMEGGES